MVVVELARPNLLIEVEAIAVRPDRTTPGARPRAASRRKSRPAKKTGRAGARRR
jgi:hypothetical protein